MKIATFNANSIRSRLPIIIPWLQQNQPDALCIQETKVQDHQFPVDAFTDIGFEVAFRGQKSYNGVAIISPHPIEELGFGLDDEPKDHSRLIKAVIKDVAIVNTYVPQGFDMKSEKFVYKLNWYKRLRKYFQTHFAPETPLVWLGDMNVALDERDVYEADKKLGSVCYCPEVSAAFNYVADFGFTDTFRMHCQDPAQYTFWDYRIKNGFKRNLGWRLDYIMATKSLAEKCTSCTVDSAPRQLEKPSDHTFLTANFNL